MAGEAIEIHRSESLGFELLVCEFEGEGRFSFAVGQVTQLRDVLSREVNGGNLNYKINVKYHK